MGEEETGRPRSRRLPFRFDRWRMSLRHPLPAMTQLLRLRAICEMREVYLRVVDLLAVPTDRHDRHPFVVLRPQPDNSLRAIPACDDSVSHNWARCDVHNVYCRIVHLDELCARSDIDPVACRQCHPRPDRNDIVLAERAYAHCPGDRRCMFSSYCRIFIHFVLSSVFLPL